MSEVFGTSYAAVYDALYQDKDYDGEVALIERLIMAHRPDSRTIVDFGCGTGAHAIRLAAHGYSVTGVDRSADMLAIAGAKVAAAGITVGLVEGDLASVRLGVTFDVALMMFAVLGYQVADADVRAALATARAHVVAGSVFIADVWYGPAVLSIKPEARTKVARSVLGDVSRSVRTTLDVAHHCAAVHYQVEMGHVVSDEAHRMRYFFDDELAAFLADAGFSMVALRAFADADAPASPETWNALVVARAV